MVSISVSKTDGAGSTPAGPAKLEPLIIPDPCNWRAVSVIQVDKNTPEDYARQEEESKKYPNRLNLLRAVIVNAIVWVCEKHQHDYLQEITWREISSLPPDPR